MPFLLTKHPLRLQLSFSSFINLMSARKAHLSGTARRARPASSPAPCPSLVLSQAAHSTCIMVVWLCHVPYAAAVFSIYTPHSPVGVLPRAKSERRERNRTLREFGTGGCGLSEALGYWSKWGQLNPNDGREQAKMEREPS